MKLISLNVWAGQAFEPLIEFIKKNKDADIFCLQEVLNIPNEKKYDRFHLLEVLKDILPNHKPFFKILTKGYNNDGENPVRVNYPLEYGQAIFVNKKIDIRSQGEQEIFNDKTGILKAAFENIPVYLQYIEINQGGRNFIICNFHGVSFPGTKLDTPLRLEQSKKIIKFLQTKDSGKIVGGDFNLLPETESVKMLEKKMTNLIKEYDIELTRSKLTPYYNTPQFQPYADYVFVSHDVKVEDFQVPNIEVSDHLPMSLEFSI